MIYCITLKNATFKEIKVKNIDVENIYKKCGYKSNNNFNKLFEWDCSSNVIEVWSKEDSNVKTYNNHPLLVRYNIKININNKAIFLLKSRTGYINLESSLFSKFFNLPQTIEFNSDEDNVEDICKKEVTNIDNVQFNNILNSENPLETCKNINADTDTISDSHSELSYELYCYSEEES